MPSRFCILTLFPLAACAPVVTHGPRVEPGAELMMTLGGPRPFCGSNTDTECNAGLVPTWGAGGRYGFTSRDSAGVAALAGLSVPLTDPLGTELDGFVQGPSPGVWAWGGGALWSPRHLMPYAQVGQVPRGGGPGWYLTLGYAHLYRDPSVAVDQKDTDGNVMARPPRYWAPGAAVRTRRGAASYTLFVQGAFGSYLRRDTFFDPATNQYVDEDVRKPVRTVLFGVVWAIGFHETHFPRPPDPPRAPPPIPVPE